MVVTDTGPGDAEEERTPIAAAAETQRGTGAQTSEEGVRITAQAGAETVSHC